MKDFFDNIINFNEFETAFMFLYNKIYQESHIFVINLKQIKKFQPNI